MSHSGLPKPLLRMRATRIVDKLQEENDAELLGFVLQVLSERAKKPVGRNPDIEWDIYLKMARLIFSGEEQEITKAAARVANLIPDLSESTVVNTMRGNFPEYEPYLKAELATEIAAEEDLEDWSDPAFEEDVEPWNL